MVHRSGNSTWCLMFISDSCGYYLMNGTKFVYLLLVFPVISEYDYDIYVENMLTLSSDSSGFCSEITKSNNKYSSRVCLLRGGSAF